MTTQTPSLLPFSGSACLPCIKVSGHCAIDGFSTLWCVRKEKIADMASGFSPLFWIVIITCLLIILIIGTTAYGFYRPNSRIGRALIVVRAYIYTICCCFLCVESPTPPISA